MDKFSRIKVVTSNQQVIKTLASLSTLAGFWL